MIIGIQMDSKKLLFRNINLLELISINFEKGENIIILSGGRKQQPFKVVLETSRASTVVKAIREVHRDLIFGFPMEYNLKVEGPQDRLLPLEIRQGPLPLASNFSLLYHASSHLLGTQVSESVSLHVENLALQEKIELDFSEIPGIEDNSSITFDLNAIGLALEHNVHFRGIIINNILRKTMIKSFAQMLQFNHYLTRLKIVNMKEGVSNLGDIGSALTANKFHTIQEIIITDTPISEKAIKSITDALVVFQHSLKTLILSGCGLSSKMITYLIKDGLLKNLGLSLNLEVLDLSNNKLDEEGSSQLHGFLLKIAEYSQLRKIYLSKCNLVLPAIIRAFHSMKNLVEIDLSHNKIDTTCAHQLCSVLETSKSLNTVLLSGCNISPGTAEMIIGSIVSNPHLYNVKLDLSDNTIGDKGVVSMTNHIIKGSNLHTLNLSKTKLTDHGIAAFARAIKQIPDSSLDSLYLDDSQGTSPQVARILLESVSFLSNLKLLSLSGGYTPPFLLHFLSGLKSNTNLLELNISKNILSDAGSVAIAALIRGNRNLLSLHCDHNRITITGYQAIYASFVNNTTLCYFDFPWSDFSKSLPHLPKGKTSVLRKILMDIQTICVTNRQKGVHPRFTEIYDDPPLNEVRPLANVPECLYQSDPLPLEDLNTNSNPVPPVGNNPPNSSLKSSVNDLPNNNDLNQNKKNNSSTANIDSNINKSSEHVPLALYYSLDNIPEKPKNLSPPSPLSVQPHNIPSIPPQPRDNHSPNISPKESLIAPPPPPPPSMGGPPPPPPAPSPPPPPSMGGPPPPPPPTISIPSVPGRSAMLDSIQGFSKNKLKKATTIDKSSPLLPKS